MRGTSFSSADVGIAWSVAGIGVLMITAANGAGIPHDVAIAGRLTVSLVSVILFTLVACGHRTVRRGRFVLTSLALVGVGFTSYAASRQAAVHGALPIHALGATFLFLAAAISRAERIVARRRLALMAVAMCVAAGMVPLAASVHRRVSQDVERYAPMRPPGLRLGDPADDARYLRWYRTQRALSRRTSGPLALIEYVDYTCGACRATFQPTLRQVEALKRTYSSLQFEVRSFPLDYRCNSAITLPHPRASSCEAAAAVLVAAREGRREQVQTALLGQEIVDHEAVAAVVREYLPGIDDRALPALFDSVKASVASEANAPIDSTPAFVLNGLRVPPVTSPLFTEVLKHEVAIRAENSDTAKER